MSPKGHRETGPAPLDLIGEDGPVVLYGWNVFATSERSSFRARGNLTIRQMAPKTTQPILCYFNGEPTVQEDWDYIPSNRDHLYYQVLPSGPLAPFVWYIVFTVALVVATVLLQPNVPTLSDESAKTSPTYNASFQGNQARLGQAIPVPYGRHLLMPDFASQPYVEYDANGDQFYYALFCLGMLDKFTIEQIAVDDTPLNHFEGITQQLVGPDHPGPLTLVNPAVVVAPEVADNDLQFGVNVGPFTVCGPGLEVSSIGIDVTLPRGLYFSENNGTLSNKSISWLVESRKVDAKGIASGGWSLLGIETITDNKNIPIRRSYRYNVADGRYEVRMRRETERDDNARAGHDIQWSGLRGYLTLVPELEPEATFLAIRAKASNQLSGTSQRRFTVIIRRWLPTWHPDTGWSEPAETKGIAAALYDVLRNQHYGARLPDNRIDLQTLYELDQVWTLRGDFFNGVFDRRTTVWQALQTIAKCGRAEPVMRGNIVTFVRDAPQELPVAMFSMRNIEQGSFSVEYTYAPEDGYDGVELEFFNEVTWASDWVTFPLPGVVGDPINPAKTSIKGISNLKQAQREAATLAAKLVYRSNSVQFSTEMEGLIVGFGDLVAVSHDICFWGTSGDIEDWDPEEKVLTSSEDLDWSSEGDYYVGLTDEFGDFHGPYLVVPGPEPRTMTVLDDTVTLDIYTGVDRERTRFAMGLGVNWSRLCRVMEVNPSSDGKVQIRLVVEDNRVHDADHQYLVLPGSGSDGRIFRLSEVDTPNYLSSSEADWVNYGYLTNAEGLMPNGDPGYVYGT